MPRSADHSSSGLTKLLHLLRWWSTYEDNMYTSIDTKIIVLPPLESGCLIIILVSDQRSFHLLHRRVVICLERQSKGIYKPVPQHLES